MRRMYDFGSSRSPLIAALLTVFTMTVCGVGCARSPAQKEARFLDRGKSWFGKKDYSRAILEFRNATQTVPRDAEPYYRLALVYLEMRQAAVAIPLLQKAVTLNPKHSAAQLKLAAFQLGNSDSKVVEGVQQRLRDVLANNPENADALEILAITEFRLGRIGDALGDLQKSIDKSPQALAHWFNLAKVKLAQKDASGAEAVLKEAALKNPRVPEAALALAQLYLGEGRKEEGESQVQRALQLDPKNANALLLLAALQEAAGQNSQAEGTYRRISTLHEPSLEPLHAVFLFKQGRRDEAISELTKLVKDNPKNRDFRGMLISGYLAMDRTRDVQKLLDAAIKENPHDTDALLQRSAFYLVAGRLQQAEGDLHTVLHFRMDSVPAHYALAKVFELRGSVLSQRQELEQALKLNPGLLPARIDLARLLSKGRGSQAALDLLNQAPAPQKMVPAYLAARNWIVMSLGNTAELRKGIDAGLAVSRTPELRYQDALLRTNQQDYQGARAVLEELMKEFPESTSSLDLLAQTYAAQDNNMLRAQQVVNAYASRQPRSAYLKYVAGIWQLKANHAGLARQAFSEAMMIGPNYIDPALLLAEMDLSDGNLTAARSKLNRVLSQQPGNLRAEFLLARVEEKAGSREEAAKLYRAVIDCNPSHAQALNNLAFGLIADHPDEALEYAQRAVGAAPEDPATQDTLGWVYYRKGNYRSAIRYLRSAVDKEPTAIRRLHLSLTYARLGDRLEAQKNLRVALELDPNVARFVPIEY
jgi:tetratricopeptide (TPR) repeat protein